MRGARAQAAIGLAGALGLHGALLGVLFFVDPPRPEIAPRRAPVQIKLVKRDPPPPEKPEPAVETKPDEPKPVEKVEKTKPPVRKKPEPKKPPTRTPKAKPKKKVAQVESPKPTPPKPSVEPKAERAQPEPTAQAKPRKARKFTVAMEATVPGGAVAVPTASGGNAWAYGAPDGAEDAPKALGGSPDGAPEGTGDGPAAPMEAAEVTVLPELVSAPSNAEMRKLYPPQARKDGLEANVSLKILVSSRGEVIRVRILKPAGNGFDEVAKKLVRQFRFEPGSRAGQAVAVWMPWTYKFRLDG